MGFPEDRVNGYGPQSVLEGPDPGLGVSTAQVLLRSSLDSSCPAMPLPAVRVSAPSASSQRCRELPYPGAANT